MSLLLALFVGWGCGNPARLSLSAPSLTVPITKIWRIDALSGTPGQTLSLIHGSHRVAVPWPLHQPLILVGGEKLATSGTAITVLGWEFGNGCLGDILLGATL